MNRLKFTVNGESVSPVVDPRASLADVLRETLDLTGTHLGCEQGVCGACTVLVDGVPVRSCISNASACDGAEIDTIEGFDNDPIMEKLRRAFNSNHALQCGFCTPGMLIMARDIVGRLDDADEDRIRLELSGNLCRCTGYVGIVKAVRSVIASRRESGMESRPSQSPSVAPAGSGHGCSNPEQIIDVAKPVNLASKKTGLVAAAHPSGARSLGTKRTVSQSFVMAFPPSEVWERFGDVPAMVRCLPGANPVGEERGGVYQIRMRVKMGPITAEFSGAVEQKRELQSMMGVINGSGHDARSSSLAEGVITYRLSEAEGGAATRVDLEIGYALSGTLGQFARPGIVKHLVSAITSQFIENLNLLLKSGNGQPLPQSDNELRLGSGILGAVRSWLRDIWQRVLSR